MGVAAVDRLPASAHHVVQFYADDAELAAFSDAFVVDGLTCGAAVVVASAARRSAFGAAMAAAGLDPVQLAAADRYLEVDSDAALAQIMCGTKPDPARFDATIGGVMRRAGRRGLPVAAYGDMVASLWRCGLHAGAVQLEELWNRLAGTETFDLYSAYPLASVTAEELGLIKQVCDAHAHVMTPRSYAASVDATAGWAGPDERSVVFMPVPMAVPASRRFATDTLNSWELGVIAEEVMIVASELATNAIVHAQSPFRLILRRERRSVRLGVADASPYEPERRAMPLTTSSGRGMPIIASLSRGWRCERVPDGKVVWVELDAS